mmetsp:Transcript_31563/g.68223  ORF Transcript_31563/g.68223 Transcript_31563/m.68223 type:complete len:320 (+) Transcript_31563:197-1156(+)
MKFKGVLTSSSIQLLEKGFLPTLLRFGKAAHMLVGPEEVHLVMRQTETGEEGPLVCVRLGKDVMFDRRNFVCQSKHLNLIAFEYELNLLERVLHGAYTNQADGLEMKLALRKVRSGDRMENRPFLTFSSKGSNLNMVQDLPISKPFASHEVDGLVDVIRSESVCPFYLDLVPVMDRVVATVATLRKMSDTVLVSLVRTGDAHFQAFQQWQLNTVGAEYRHLEVIPEAEGSRDRDVSQQSSPTRRLDKAREKDLHATLAVSSKQLARVLAVHAFTKPTKLLCGIDQNANFLHLLFVYVDALRDAVTDKESMSIKLSARLQ